MSATTPSLQYLHLARKRLEAARAGLPRLIGLGEAMAGHLLAGGDIFAPGINRFWANEFKGRAGGLMGLWVPPKFRRHDLAYFVLPDPRRWDPRKDDSLKKLIKEKLQLFVVGNEDELAPLGSTKRFAGFTGAAGAGEGLYGTPDIRPLACLRPFDQLVRGWVAAGEMIAACTRGGKMPVMWMSVWLEGALVRNQSFFKKDNLHEPWRVPVFHEDYYVPPLARGHVGGEFLDFAGGLLEILKAQAPQLARAGRWLAESKKTGRKNRVTLVGHSYPEILELADPGKYPLTWGPSISDLRYAVPACFGAGDVCLHLGYAPVDVKSVAAILKRGIRLIHTSPYGRPADLPDHKNFIWLDLPWRPADATLDVPGYSVRILPGSSIAQTLAYFSIISEMAARMGWQ